MPDSTTPPPSNLPASPLVESEQASTSPELSLSDVIEKLGLAELPQEKQEDFMVQLAELIQLRLTNRISNYLTDEQLTELDKLIESDNEDAANSYIEKNVPSYDSMVQEEINRAVGELGQDADEIKKLVSAAVAERGESGDSPEPTV